MRKRFVVCDSTGKEVDGVQYVSRRAAMNGPWDQAIVECGYTVKRINLELQPLPTGETVWARKEMK